MTPVVFSFVMVSPVSPLRGLSCTSLTERAGPGRSSHHRRTAAVSRDPPLLALPGHRPDKRRHHLFAGSARGGTQIARSGVIAVSALAGALIGWLMLRRPHRHHSTAAAREGSALGLRALVSVRATHSLQTT